MKESTYKSYDDLPLFLNTELVAQVLGISQARAYDLLHNEGFPVLKMGTHRVVPKEQFRQWVESKASQHDRYGLHCEERSGQKSSANPGLG